MPVRADDDPEKDTRQKRTRQEPALLHEVIALMMLRPSTRHAASFCSALILLAAGCHHSSTSPSGSSGGTDPPASSANVQLGDDFGGQAGYPIPPIAATQPGYVEGGVAGGGTTGDRHLLIVDRDRWQLFELFAARW